MYKNFQLCRGIYWALLFLAACQNRDTHHSDEIETRANSIVGELTLEEKVEQMTGAAILPTRGLWLTPALDSFGLPGYRMTDGPRGVSANKPLYGSTALAPTTCFPVGMARGATFDVELEERVGRAIGREVRAWGGNVILAPVINILRHPAWGRAQETYGEDSYHLGKMGAAFVRGAQENVIASVKHFALNSIENTRLEVDVVASERVLREVYLPHFKEVVMDAEAGSVMTAYNSVNGDFCSENDYLLRDILKGEWEFEGFVISDWIWGTHNTEAAAKAGLDIEMPSGKYYGAELVKAVENGRVPETVIDESVRRILKKQIEFELDQRSPEPDPLLVDADAHSALALEVAQKSMVLLKNENDALPIDPKKAGTLALVGSFAQRGRIGDDGSSSVEPAYVVTPFEGFQNRSETVKIQLIDRDVLSPEDKTAIAAADVAVVVVGFTPEEEGEKIDILNIGGDRETLDLPESHQSLIREVAAIQQKTIVIIEAGSAVTMEAWVADVAAVLLAWYPGQEGGNAIADVVFGTVPPSGRLPLTIPISTDQLPVFDSQSLAVTYDYFHGYRLLDHNGEKPRFPFGHGLTYTEFAYTELSLSQDKIPSAGNLTVRWKVTNIGKRAGVEVAQLYISYPGSKVERALKDLKGFARVTLEPGETRLVELPLRIADLAYFDEKIQDWTVENITYGVHVGSSSGDLRLERSLQVID